MFSRFLALSKSLRPSRILDILRMHFWKNKRERERDLPIFTHSDASQFILEPSLSRKRSIFRSSLGFTMVEVMIVIAILGILAAAIMPLSWYYMMRARDLARVVDTHNLEKVLMMYEMDYGIFPAHELGCYPHNSIKSYLRKTYISPRWNGYDEGCGSSGMYGYWVSTDGHTALLMAMMERSRGGNYTGSTLWMTGSLTPLGDSNAMNTRKWDGNIYIVKIGGWSGTNTPVPPVPVITDGDCSTTSWLCLAGSPSGYSAPVCGGSRTWTCKGQNGGIDKSCSIINTVCPANVTATFDANGGTGLTPANKVVPYNTTIWTLPNVLPPPYDEQLSSFKGWYTEVLGGVQITENTTISTNTTYYAQWDCPAAGYSNSACTVAGKTFVANSKYLWCNIPDKVVCVCIGKAQTWSMCNVGSNTAGMTSASYGYMYQWWRNIPLSSTGNISTVPWPLSLDAANTTTHFITSLDRTSQSNWLSYKNANLWWWGLGWGWETFISLGSPNAMKWPCESGYHIPTAKEWCPKFPTVGACTFDVDLVNVLQLPPAWARFGNMPNHILWGPLYQSSDSWNNKPYIYGGSGIHDAFIYADSMPVRCIKDSE